MVLPRVAAALAAGLLSAIVLVPPLSAQAPEAASPAGPAPWPHDADIPRPGPVSPDLAGSARPDIVRYLMVRRAGAPALSPDGRTLAFRIATTGEPQLWTVPVDGGWPRQLTFGRGVTFHAWGPQGAGLIYGADRDGDEREGYRRIAADGTAEQVVRPYSDAFVRFGDFSSDGRRIVYSTTERNGVDFDVHVLDLASGDSREVLQGRYGFYAETWQPGGDLVVVSEARGETANNVYLVDVTTGARRTLFKPGDAAAYSGFAWTPDGAGFYLATNEDRDLMALAYYDLEAGSLRLIETPAGDVGHVSLSADGRYLAWTVNRDGFSRLYVRDRQTGQDIAPEALPAGVVRRIVWASDAPVMALSLTAPGLPGDIWTFDAAERRLTRATHATDAGLDLATEAVAPTSHRFAARDGVQLHGLLYRPVDGDSGGPVPVVLMVHGGPSAQARPTFDPVIQYLVHRGIAVFDFNYRGSTGFGKRFARLNDRRQRPDEMGDLEDAAAWLGAMPGLDGDRIAIMGGSYGGYLTNAALGALPDTFAAGVSFVGVSDWVRALEGASPALKASDRVEYGDIEDPDDRAFFRSISPINKADRIAAPLMVIHGANDPRDPVSESDRLVQAVRDQGHEVVYLRFADEGHGIRKLDNRVHAYRRIAAFLERHLGLTQ
ncbi:peptidase S9 [Rhodothalassium salexigens]|uniref:S9 family peptidase n=1 Tax=Rhodothalassium salexigens TaxID=1086 RepID=UPI0019123DB8|nr:S9 family peptidase [Rhodothalassium salexigens]MBK5910292.1 peptidase S9 [Rhodothalassium salexigens]MBK5921500.1 peptidase S9 [Rhodothalassium salexigens]